MPVDQSVGNLPQSNILLNKTSNGSNRMVLALIKYSFNILSAPHDLFVESPLIAFCISTRLMRSSKASKVVSLASKSRTKSTIGSPIVSCVSADNRLKYSKKSLSIF